MKRLIITGLAWLMTTALLAQVDDDWSKRVRESQEEFKKVKPVISEIIFINTCIYKFYLFYDSIFRDSRKREKPRGVW